MTEWEKMQQGLVYNDFYVKICLKWRFQQKKLFRAYNKTRMKRLNCEQGF